MRALAVVVVSLAVLGSLLRVAGACGPSEPPGPVLTPAEVIADAASLLEKEPIVVRFRVVNTDTMPLITETGQSRTEVRLHPANEPSEATTRASFYVGVSPKAQRDLRRLGIELSEHFRGKFIEVRGRLHMAGLSLVGSEDYSFYMLIINDLDQLTVLGEKEPVLLAAAVESFNKDAMSHPIGMTQPPLTEDELIAVLRWTILEEGSKTRTLTRISDPSPSAETFDLLREIVATGRLPDNVAIEFMAGYEPDDELVFEVWSIRLRITRPDGSSFVVSVREQMLHSRVMGPMELKLVRQLREQLAKGVGSMQRAALMEKFRLDREEAIRRDRR